MWILQESKALTLKECLLEVWEEFQSDWMSLSDRYTNDKPTLDSIAQIRANITLK